MGLRFRRSVKIMPGVRLNVGMKSAGISVGPRGAKVTINTKGRVGTSVGIPGSGIYYTTSRKAGTQNRKRNEKLSNVPSNDYQNNVPKPGLLSSGGEKAFYEWAINFAFVSLKTFDEVIEAGEKVKHDFQECSLLVDYLLITRTATVDSKKALQLAEKCYLHIGEIATNPIAQKYFGQFTSNVPIARGIFIHTDYKHDFLSFIYSELLQMSGDCERALDVVEKIPSNPYKEIARLDLYISLKNYEKIVQHTNGISNNDDMSSLSLIFRAVAFRELNQYELSVEAFKLALSKKSRSEEILNYGLYERACTHEIAGKKSMAIKDLSKILASDFSNEAAKEKLRLLQTSANHT